MVEVDVGVPVGVACLGAESAAQDDEIGAAHRAIVVEVGVAGVAVAVRVTVELVRVGDRGAVVLAVDEAVAL